MELVKTATGEPITRAELKTSLAEQGLELLLPSSLEGVNLHEYGVAVVEPAAPTSTGPNETAAPNGAEEYAPGKWRQVWAIRPLTEAELDAMIPMEVTLRQAKLMLYDMGKLSTAEAALQALPKDQRTAALIEWNTAQTVRRDHPWVQALFAVIGLTPKGLKQAFKVAATK